MLRAGIVQKRVLPVDAAVQTGDLLLDSTIVRGRAHDHHPLPLAIVVLRRSARRPVSFRKAPGEEPGCADAWACDSNHARNACSKGFSAFSSGQAK